MHTHKILEYDLFISSSITLTNNVSKVLGACTSILQLYWVRFDSDVLKNSCCVKGHENVHTFKLFMQIM